LLEVDEVPHAAYAGGVLSDRREGGMGGILKDVGSTSTVDYLQEL
jgi:hypothetical protein